MRAVAPFTEADPLGVLACSLVGVGNALGRGVHHRIGRQHGVNLFVLLVGDTSSRKGTCWDVAEMLLSLAQPQWAEGCIENRFGSGQGLIYRIRDAYGDDMGIADKRLMVVEEEFAKPLRLMRSESSILSANLRAAYDGKPLAVMNKGENRYGVREPHFACAGGSFRTGFLNGSGGSSPLFGTAKKPGEIQAFSFSVIRRPKGVQGVGDRPSRRRTS